MARLTYRDKLNRVLQRISRLTTEMEDLRDEMQTLIEEELVLGKKVPKVKSNQEELGEKVIQLLEIGLGDVSEIEREIYQERRQNRCF